MAAAPYLDLQAIEAYLAPFGFRTVLEAFSHMDIWLVR